MITENSVSFSLAQPKPLPQPATSLQHGMDGEGTRQQNGLHTVLSNGHGTAPRGHTAAFRWSHIWVQEAPVARLTPHAEKASL